MKKAILILLCLLLALALTAEVLFILRNQPPVPEETVPTTETTETAEPETTEPETEPETTEPETTEPETEPETTEPETEATEETQPESGEKRYVLTFVGDCTLGSTPNQYGIKYSLIHTVGTDYDYPFRNVAEYFKKDDFTFINLEGVLADSGNASNARFTFRGPTAYTQILTGSSVEAVTLANNHTQDYGKDGYASTTKALSEAGVAYVETNGSALYKTESGLTIGMYAFSFKLDGGAMRTAISNLRKNGAEIVIVAAHWGNEGQYRPTKEQQSFAHAAVEAGADIVYGSHPHVLQKIEEYKGSIIYYSMGNFCFGGNNYPRDLDSVILQQEIIRGEDGKVRLGELTQIPVSCSSLPVQNNFQPTPYAEGSDQYKRTLSKLDGSFKGPDLLVDYDATKPTTAPSESTTPTEGGSTGTTPTEGGSTGTTPTEGSSSGSTTPSAPSGGGEENVG